MIHMTFEHIKGTNSNRLHLKVKMCFYAWMDPEEAREGDLDLVPRGVVWVVQMGVALVLVFLS